MQLLQRPPQPLQLATFQWQQRIRTFLQHQKSWPWQQSSKIYKTTFCVFSEKTSS